MRSWLEGKKTYLLAALVVTVVLVLVFLGRMTPETGITIGLFAMSLFATTFRASLAAHQRQSLQILADAASLGAAYAAHNPVALRIAGQQAASDGIQLVEAIRNDGGSKA